MSANTLSRRVAGDDGSGENTDWRLWNAETDGIGEDLGGSDGTEFYDAGRRILLAGAAGRAGIAGLAPNFETDMRLPTHRRALPPTIGRLALPPNLN